MTDETIKTGCRDKQLMEEIGFQQLRSFGARLLEHGLNPSLWGGLHGSENSAWVNGLDMSDEELRSYGVTDKIITTINTQWHIFLKELGLE